MCSLALAWLDRRKEVYQKGGSPAMEASNVSRVTQGVSTKAGEKDAEGLVPPASLFSNILRSSDKNTEESPSFGRILK
jgi:hypothetical protein